MSFASLNNLQAAILEKNFTLALPDIKPNQRISPQAQINIYVEGYRLRLLAAIRSDYPETLTLIGEKKFDELALEFIEQNPSENYNLDFYPHKFANFLLQLSDKSWSEAISDRVETKHAQHMSVIKDSILKEQAIAIVFMGEESEPVAPNELAKLSPEEFGNLILKPRLASKFLQSLYVYRHNNEVQKVPLSEAEYLLLEKLFAGTPVTTALDELITNYPQYQAEIAQNLTNWFSKWTAQGFFA